MKKLHNVDIKDYTTFKVPSKVKELVFIEEENELFELFQTPLDRFMVIGKGSNVLFVEDYEGTVIHMATKSFKIEEENEEWVLVTVDAGLEWDDWVEISINKGWFGLENLSLIPGSVGAAPVQNIGAYGVEVSAFVHRVKVFDVVVKSFSWVASSACDFGYRQSIFQRKHEWIVTAVQFKLSKKFNPQLSYPALKTYFEHSELEKLTASDVRKAVIEIRTSKLPNPDQMGNAGSFFKNPMIDIALSKEIAKKYPDFPVYPAGEGKIKTHAAWLIEKAGLKGFTLGDAAVHEKQPLVLVNRGNATGKDMIKLAAYVQQQVFEKFKIWLEPEVRIIKN